MNIVKECQRIYIYVCIYENICIYEYSQRMSKIQNRRIRIIPSGKLT